MTDQKKYTGKLAGARILIVGGSAGLGYGVAEAALEHGASIVISSSQQSRVDEAIASLKNSYPSAIDNVIGYACDLGTEETLERNVKDLLEKTGVVDHIVYTAGDRLAMKPIEDIDFALLKKEAWCASLRLSSSANTRIRTSSLIRVLSPQSRSPSGLFHRSRSPIGASRPAMRADCI
jgi:NAD(P)-dependent dehydrogenase (short-subunit alcohol dehydrogenase family)